MNSLSREWLTVKMQIRGLGLILHAYVQFQATNLALSRPWILYPDIKRNSEGTEVEAQYSSYLSEKIEAVAELPFTQKTCIVFVCFKQFPKGIKQEETNKT